MKSKNIPSYRVQETLSAQFTTLRGFPICEVALGNPLYLSIADNLIQKGRRKVTESVPMP